MVEKQVFGSRPSIGVISLVITAAVVIALCVPVIQGEVNVVGIISIVFLGGVGVVALLFALWLPGLRYEVGDDVVIRFGPLVTTIPISSIKEIRRQDVTLAAVSLAIPLPGVVIGTMVYGGLGKVKMYSRAMLKGVFIIETDQGKFGITPERDDEMAKLIQAKMDG